MGLVVVARDMLMNNFPKQASYLITRHNDSPIIINNLMGACARLCQTPAGTPG